MAAGFDLQGHRGARGLKPENTLPSFEAALDLLVSSLETDVHLSQDDVPVLWHDPFLSDTLVRKIRGRPVPDPSTHPPVRCLTVAALRGYIADKNPGRRAFPHQNNHPTPLARIFCEERQLADFSLVTLEDLLDFIRAYFGPLGTRAGKTELQCGRARGVRINLELKRVPYHPEYIGDGGKGLPENLLESRVLDLCRGAGTVDRTRILSFDHRSLRAVRRLEPRIETAALISGTAPASIPALVEAAGAQIYSPDFAFLDLEQVRDARAAGIRVVPYTVNETEDMQRLLDWGVDGIVTDYPDRLAPLLRARGIKF